MKRYQEKLLEQHPGHKPRISRQKKGTTPTAPSRPVYGTRLTCACRWWCRSNEAPSKGGESAVLAHWERHLGNPDLEEGRLT